MKEGLCTPPPIPARLPQCSVFAPALYSLYLHDIPPQEVGVDVALYADDMTLFTSDQNVVRAMLNLQQAVANIEHWCSRWNIMINEGKFQVIIISKKSFHHILTLG